MKSNIKKKPIMSFGSIPDCFDNSEIITMLLFRRASMSTHDQYEI